MGGNEREKDAPHVLKASFTMYFLLSLGRRRGEILTGWSASKSDPYISTRFAHLSKSEIFFGYQGIFSMSMERMESTKLLITPSVLREETLLSSLAMAVTGKIYKLKGYKQDKGACCLSGTSLQFTLPPLSLPVCPQTAQHSPNQKIWGGSS